jgi:hypothetical protein
MAERNSSKAAGLDTAAVDHCLVPQKKRECGEDCARGNRLPRL